MGGVGVVICECGHEKDKKKALQSWLRKVAGDFFLLILSLGAHLSFTIK